MMYYKGNQKINKSFMEKYESPFEGDKKAEEIMAEGERKMSE